MPCLPFTPLRDQAQRLRYGLCLHPEDSKEPLMGFKQGDI